MSLLIRTDCSCGRQSPGAIAREVRVFQDVAVSLGHSIACGCVYVRLCAQKRSSCTVSRLSAHRSSTAQPNRDGME